ncbi:AAA-like domain-containing protein [Nostoc sp. PA-18-2419]|uniref:AAA-like domain-containing protein n=1 Tax=Nostoc sp. PA-18-2419 TaxID=2575443 RepID=UPI001109B37B|nr:AAA-like domain-containing protein [Nostoc sp. PA-18-2419]
MTIDEVALLLKASQAIGLTTLQEIVLRSSWEGKTYTNIAVEADYAEDRVKKVAADLWQILSHFYKEPINESNFRQTLENHCLNKTHQQLLREFNRAATAISLEFPNGPVSLNSRFYISRPPIEEVAYAEMAQPGSVICIKAPKKMGKSSLVLRLLARAKNQGFRTVSLDFLQADKPVFTSLNKFLRWFCANVSRELQLEPKLNDYWDENMGSKVSCSIYFQKYLLSALETPLVLVLNEANWVFEYQEIAGEFLALVRLWHEQAKAVEIWQKLRLVLVYSTEIIVPIKLSQSLFNIGLPIKLPLFTKEQVQDLAQRHGLDWTDGRDADSLMAIVGGHPYLVRLALYHLIGKGGLQGNLEQLLQQAPTELGIYHEYLRQYILLLQDEPELVNAFYQVINTNNYVKLEPILAYKLQGMGLINLEGDRSTPTCKLYRLYFREYLKINEEFNNNRINQLKQENQQLLLLSSLDELTQLVNRHYFQTYLQIEWQNSILQHTPISLILCDIDYFKIYNKTYGNTAGDRCLRKIANTICNSIKYSLGNSTFSYSNHKMAYPATNYFATLSKADLKNENTKVLVARYGGEEFAILAKVDIAMIMNVAEYIREHVKALAIKCEYPNIGGLPAAVLTVSLGVASIIPEVETEPATLVNAAEQALYHAKRQGRDRVVLG